MVDSLGWVVSFGFASGLEIWMVGGDLIFHLLVGSGLLSNICKNGNKSFFFSSLSFAFAIVYVAYVDKCAEVLDDII
jgi:hypothetical protein